MSACRTAASAPSTPYTNSGRPVTDVLFRYPLTESERLKLEGIQDLNIDGISLAYLGRA